MVPISDLIKCHSMFLDPFTPTQTNQKSQDIGLGVGVGVAIAAPVVICIIIVFAVICLYKRPQMKNSLEVSVG